MDPQRFTRIGEAAWRLEPVAGMRVPGILYADEALLRDMDDKVGEQLANVARLPGIVRAAYAMPDAHWGYGFPIGGVAAFDPDEGGVVSAGGVGFDISCGVRNLLTGIEAGRIASPRTSLADALYEAVPVGLGSKGAISLDRAGMDAMLAGGARWAVGEGYGREADLERTEERGEMRGARPDCVSDHAKERQRREMDTLGSGNHYLEIQEVVEIHDPHLAEAFGLRVGEAVVSIHCGSRGLGHQIGTEFLRDMAADAERRGFALPDRELACAPIRSDIGEAYLGAMRAAVNCALANRQIITHLVRRVFGHFFPEAPLDLLFDVSLNTCKTEIHPVDGRARELYVHRKGATRAFGPGRVGAQSTMGGSAAGHEDLPAAFAATGQPVLIGGSMGTESYVLVGTAEGEAASFSSACHGAGRCMSRHQALKRWKGRQVVDELAAQGIVIRSPSSRGVAEEAPGAYKDATAVVEAAEKAGLARKVARLRPMICIKG